MSSDRRLAESVLETLFNLLNEERIVREVDIPLGRASIFFPSKEPPKTCSAFNRLISDLLRFIYKKGLKLPRNLSRVQALAEAIFFLEAGYQNENARGYECAILDAIGTDSTGIDHVLSQMVELIKASEREKYINWVFTHHYLHLDWQAKEQIVTVYLEKNEKVLPAELGNMDPARLIDYLPKLIIDDLADKNTINQIVYGEWYQNGGL